MTNFAEMEGIYIRNCHKGVTFWSSIRSRRCDVSSLGLRDLHYELKETTRCEAKIYPTLNRPLSPTRWLLELLSFMTEIWICSRSKDNSQWFCGRVNLQISSIYIYSSLTPIVLATKFQPSSLQPILVKFFFPSR